ncbi:DUF2971 domain-containing protein [Rhizobium leguminosarum]|uniref:DUF2971 domain-containing protein n=1 Tax=Rhizobium leguminosarum TaxID=384 RepID=UPI001C94E15B|nr:DUF2971 domain-containing protein [Rhizobium leguminosarum]MBY5533650.1 DUF2971 domain-containing protein [Rhizobium leguminosarum]
MTDLGISGIGPRGSVGDSNDLFAGLPSLLAERQEPRSDLPPTLSHYCDLYALNSILIKHSLWASNIRFLNDKKEMDFGIDVAKDLLDELRQSTYKGSTPMPPSRRIAITDIPDVYAVCFCEKSDLLSQWRGYGSTQQSVSIQFDSSGLLTLGFMKMFSLKKIIYGREKALAQLRDGFDRIDDIVGAISRREPVDTPAEQKRVILELSPQFKTEHFEEEQEWRLVSFGEQKQISYRPRDNVLLPYVQVGHPANIPLPIGSITVGPGKDNELTKKSIEHLLANSAYPHVQVRTSEIPFRV